MRVGFAALLTALVAMLIWMAPTGASGTTGASAGERGALARDATVYQAASDTSKVLGVLPAGTEVTVLEIQGDWALIETKARRVYVSLVDLTASAAETDAAIGVTLMGRTLFVARDVLLESYGSKNLMMLNPGDRVTLLGITGDAAEVLYVSRAGTVPLDALAVDREGDYVLGAAGDSTFDLESRLEALGYFDGVPNDLFDLETAEALIRFRMQTGLGDAFEVDDALYAALFDDAAPSSFVRIASLIPGDTGNTVRRLQNRLIAKGYLETDVLGQYDSLTVQAVLLYQQMERLEETGLADAPTMSRLFSGGARTLPRNLMPASAQFAPYLPGGTVNVDWFESDISEIFSFGTVAEITDVATGLTWHEIRRGGYNHADVQPLTAQDTAIMKTALGGQWSWDRRAIWVGINGIRYAASMNCMPHGDGAIAGNNFGGHHCIHFLNSRTHGTDLLDDQHQACVALAAATDYVTMRENWNLLDNTVLSGAPDED